jgi:biotin operon repressor
VSPLDDWTQLKPDTELAVAQLLTQLRSGASTQDLLDSYLYAKKLLAESMQAFIRVDIDERNTTFHDLHEQLHNKIRDRYAGRVPTRYLKVPYSSRVHEELFALLLQRRGAPVPAALLRIVTGDSIHTERRIRELRELGFDIRSSKENGHDLYTLDTLDIDTSFIPTIVGNIVKKDRSLPEAEQQALLERIDYRDE